MKRSSGVLMHITSLPGRYGIGTLGASARRFADFCHKAGLSWWQILPIGPTGYGNSPYQSDSTFAGNPLLIDLEELIGQGLLTCEECEQRSWAALDKKGRPQTERVDFDRVREQKTALLHLAFQRARQDSSLWARAEQFFDKEAWWLDDYALYLAVKEQQGQKPWQQWEEEIRLRRPQAMQSYRTLLKEEIDYHRFVQFLFYDQWERFRSYCHCKGVKLIGDIPIYVAPDSSDTWANTRLFEYDADCRPLRVAGCPPDYFSKTGQLWGNPLYRWDVMEQEGFAWWISRIAAMSRLFDLTRIDHFRGFAGYYAIDAKAETAVDGVWEKGPGMKLFSAVRRQLPKVSLIAEDLGFITEDVEQLRDRCGFPGMKVLQFAFSPEEESGYLPHNCPKRAVIYTGTHDNDTTRGWAHTAGKQEREAAAAYLGVSHKKQFAWGMIRAAWTSPCELAIAPMQDFLNLGTDCRMNLPSTVGGNWEWRMREGAADKKLAERIRRLTQASWRLPNYRSGLRAVQQTKED